MTAPYAPLHSGAAVVDEEVTTFVLDFVTSATSAREMEMLIGKRPR